MRHHLLKRRILSSKEAPALPQIEHFPSQHAPAANEEKSFIAHMGNPNRYQPRTGPPHQTASNLLAEHNSKKSFASPSVKNAASSAGATVAGATLGKRPANTVVSLPTKSEGSSN